MKNHKYHRPISALRNPPDAIAHRLALGFCLGLLATALPVAAQCLQPVAGWDAQELQRSRRVKLLQLAQCHGFNVDKPGHPAAIEQGFSLGTAKGLQHGAMLTPCVITRKHQRQRCAGAQNTSPITPITPRKTAGVTVFAAFLPP